jgi:hypothetical protein
MFWQSEHNMSNSWRYRHAQFKIYCEYILILLYVEKK